jgi:DNA invertase Pin-like site-specific DNA recombinase
MKNVVAYCRSACEAQGGPSAVRDQAHAILSNAQREVSLIYLDAGVSDVTLERPALQQLIADCLAGKIATVITQDPDRLSRDRRQLAELLQIFRKANVRVEFTAGSQSIQLLEPLLSAFSELDEATR